MIIIKDGEITKHQKNRFGIKWEENIFTNIRIENQPYIKADERDPEDAQTKELIDFFSSNKLEAIRNDVSAIMTCAGQLDRLSLKGA